MTTIIYLAILNSRSAVKTVNEIKYGVMDTILALNNFIAAYNESLVI